MTFLTVVTRHMPKRAEMLHTNSDSLAAQTETDFERLLLVDGEGRGIAWSHAMLAERDWQDVGGDYVLLLDDDDVLADEGVVAKLKEGAAGRPDLMVVQMDHGPRGILPASEDYGKLPERGKIGVSAVVPSRELFLEAVRHFQPVYAGDYDYVKACFECAQVILWLPMIATRVTQIGARTGR